MKVCIDGSPILGLQSGFYRYVSELIKNIALIDVYNDYQIFFFLFNKNMRKNFRREMNKLPNQKNFSYRTTLIPRSVLDVLWNEFGFKFPRIELFTGKCDIFHSTSCWLPEVKKTKTVVTLYDLTVFKLPNLYQYSLKESEKIFKKISLYADKIIAISENTKKDFIEIFGTDPQKIIVIPLGVSENFRPLQNKERIKSALQKYGIMCPYLLHTGTILLHKNLQTIIKVFGILKEKFGIPHKLVIVGEKKRLNKVLYQVEISPYIFEHIIFTGQISQEDLISIYNGADLFIFLSLYEGFGLPPLEAMACGVPVVVSNVSSLPEVVGAAGILVNPLNIDEIVDAIIKIISDMKLKKELSEKGLKRAKEFSWQKTAIETLSVYKELC
jgi:glycosyltransferase involved in cell wall biosynthesis